MERKLITFEECFTAKHMYASAKKCLKGVRWKTSVLNFERNMLSNCSQLLESVIVGKHKSPNFTKIKISGKKPRIVSAVDIKERTVEKCFCDYCFLPNFINYLSYNNCAVLPGRGQWYAIKKVKKYYINLMKKFPEGYIIITDFHDYFHSIEHDKLYKIIKPRLDDKSFQFYKTVIQNMEGLELGSQISQLSGVIYVTSFDRLGERLSSGYVRYMDDTISFYPSKIAAENALKSFKEEAKLLGLRFNQKKTRIIKAKSGFTFLKKKFKWLKENNKCLVQIRRESINEEKRRIKHWRKKKVPVEQQKQMFQGWSNSLRKLDSKRQLPLIQLCFSAIL